jgi:hypothetical protein
LVTTLPPWAEVKTPQAIDRIAACPVPAAAIPTVPASLFLLVSALHGS